MKKSVLITIMMIFISLAAFLIIRIIDSQEEQKLYESRIKQLPQFSFTTLSGTSFSSSEVKNGPLLIVYFHPGCGHCEYEVSELCKSSLFEYGISVLLVSGAARDSVRNFLGRVSCPENDRLKTLIDTAALFSTVFGKAIIPSGYLYDRNLSLIDSFYGEYRIETILNRFRESE